MEYQTALQQKIREVIRSGNTAQVFNILRAEQLSADQVKALTLIESQFHETSQAELKGILSTDDLQIRKNRINNQLLNLVDTPPENSKTKSTNFQKIGIAIISLLLVGGGLSWWWWSQEEPCPSYPIEIRNKILVLPFENVGSDPAKPHVSLSKRINELTAKNNLSAKALLAHHTKDNLSNQQVIQLGKKCDLELMVWGTYSSRPDSLRVVLEYYFTKKTKAQNSSQLITLKDVTGLQKGTMVKSLDDAILSLCGVIALREGDAALAAKWFNKVKQKEELDVALLKALGTIGN